MIARSEIGDIGGRKVYKIETDRDYSISEFIREDKEYGHESEYYICVNNMVAKKVGYKKNGKTVVLCDGEKIIISGGSMYRNGTMRNDFHVHKT